MENEKMLQDILETVTFIKDNAVSKDEFNQEIGGINQEISGIKEEIGGIKGELTAIKAVMVTKDYLDDKLADLKGDIIVKQRKIESRIDTLVTMLSNRKVLEKTDVKLLSDLRIFPHIID